MKSFVSGLDTVTQWKEADSADDAMLVADKQLARCRRRAPGILDESLCSPSRIRIQSELLDVAYEDCDQHGPYAIAKEKRILDICHP